jgi:hypothetical protein
VGRWSWLTCGRRTRAAVETRSGGRDSEPKHKNRCRLACNRSQISPTNQQGSIARPLTFANRVSIAVRRREAVSVPLCCSPWMCRWWLTGSHPRCLLSHLPIDSNHDCSWGRTQHTRSTDHRSNSTNLTKGRRVAVVGSSRGDTC